jgi:hypothetical protein
MIKRVYDGNLDTPMCEECNQEMHYGEGHEGNKLVAYLPLRRLRMEC